MVWKARFALEGEVQAFQRLIKDQDGNVYVSGGAYVPGDGHVAVIIKYLRNGAEAWSRIYQTATNAVDSVYRLTVDRQGELSAIISTFTQGRSSASVVRLDRDGNLLAVWEDPWLLTAAAGDLDGNIFVSGFLRNDEGGLDNVLAKYDAHGQRVWQRPAAFPHPELGAAHVLAIDPAGNVYAAGPEISILKYNRDGDHLWAANFSGRHSLGMVLDNHQNVYVTGLSGPGRANDTLTVKLDSSGRELWQSTYRDPQVSRTVPLDIAANEKGETFIVTLSSLTYSVIKYNALGQVVWLKKESGSVPHARLGVDEQRGVWLWSTSSAYDALLVHYDAAGRRHRVHRYETSPRGVEWAADMLVGKRNQIVLTYYSIDRSGPAWVTSSLAHRNGFRFQRYRLGR